MRPAITSAIAGAVPRNTTTVACAPAAACTSSPQRLAAEERPAVAKLSLSPSRCSASMYPARSAAGKPGRAIKVMAASDTRPSGAKLPGIS